MTCKAGDLVFIPFPYADLSSTKKRPVLVLTSPDIHGDFIALAVTTVPQSGHALTLGNDNLAQGGLPKQSWIRLDKVFTLASSSIVKTFGTVREEFIRGALAGICGVLGYRDRPSSRAT